MSNTLSRREERMAEAKVRQEAYNKLTTQQKLERHDLYAGPTGGARQRARLMARLEAENLAIVEKAAKKAKKG